MAPLDVVKVLISPLQRPIIEWTAATVAPVNYIVQASRIDQVHVVSATVAGTKTVARLPHCYRPASYTVQVTADYAPGGPADITVIHPTPVPIVVQCGMANLIRQAVYDAVYDAGITFEGRNLVLLSNAYFAPVIMGSSKVPGMALPVFEVGNVSMTSSGKKSQVRREQMYRVPMRLLDAYNKEDTDASDRLWYLFERVQKAVDEKENLDIACHGILDRNWDWKVREGKAGGRDRLSGLVFELLVPVEQGVGVLTMT